MNPRVVAYGILAMLAGVTHWVEQQHPLTKEDVWRKYTRLAVGAIVDPQEEALALA
ncbi:hypothetical protein [Paracoccus solventivorans]|uniref:hypothetical protein n=1 Tax=Paracoccus solventivorans TaxID=53463 RepID=UPI0013565C10|nr:hypothetical protein [Paracoccus solventivorans]